jgi:hypothetical protein
MNNKIVDKYLKEYEDLTSLFNVGSSSIADLFKLIGNILILLVKIALFDGIIIFITNLMIDNYFYKVDVYNLYAPYPFYPLFFISLIFYLLIELIRTEKQIGNIYTSVCPISGYTNISNKISFDLYLCMYIIFICIISSYTILEHTGLLSDILSNNDPLYSIWNHKSLLMLILASHIFLISMPLFIFYCLHLKFKNLIKKELNLKYQRLFPFVHIKTKYFEYSGKVYNLFDKTLIYLDYSDRIISSEWEHILLIECESYQKELKS